MPEAILTEPLQKEARTQVQRRKCFMYTLNFRLLVRILRGYSRGLVEVSQTCFIASLSTDLRSPVTHRRDIASLRRTFPACRQENLLGFEEITLGAPISPSAPGKSQNRTCASLFLLLSLWIRMARMKARVGQNLLHQCKPPDDSTLCSFLSQPKPSVSHLARSYRF